MSDFLIYPIILPLIAGAAAIIVRNSPEKSFILALTSAGLQLVAAVLLLYQVHLNGTIATQVGNWQARPKLIALGIVLRLANVPAILGRADFADPLRLRL